MADRTSIEWTDASWNPIRARNRVTGRVGWHCEHVSPGCAGCYAGTMNAWRGTKLPYKPGHRNEIEIFLDEKMLLAPLRWKKPRMIFVCSMTDLFADFVTDEMIDRVFAVMALCPQHKFQVPTKRPARMRVAITRIGRAIDILERQARRIGYTLKWEVQAEVAAAIGRQPGQMIGLVPWPLPNLWLGVSAEDQSRADERIPDLLATPAAVRFVSLEPLLGAIDLTEWLRDGHPTQEQVDGPRGMHYLRHGAPRLDWVIVGGESGPHARPMHPDWERRIRKDCAAAGVPYFGKQWGEWAWADTDPLNPNVPMNWREHPERYACLDRMGNRTSGYGGNGEEFMVRVGKARAGRRFDGVEHNGMPGR